MAELAFAVTENDVVIAAFLRLEHAQEFLSNAEYETSNYNYALVKLSKPV